VVKGLNVFNEKADMGQHDTSGPTGAITPLPFRQLFDAAPALISIHEGADHVYIYTNPAHDRVFQASKFHRRAFRDAFPGPSSEALFERLNEVFQSGTPMEMPEVEALVDADGTGAQRRYFRVVIQPWHDPAGAIAGIMGFSFDVTGQVQARMRAEASERHMSYALKASGTVGTYYWDTKSDRMSIDEAFVTAFGFSGFSHLDQLPLQTFIDVIHPDDRSRVMQAIQTAVQTGEHFEQHYRTVDAQGVVRHILAQGRCLRDAQGQPDRFTGVVTDTTRQRQAEQTLRDNEARLRSIFTSIDQGYGMAEMILDPQGKPVDYRFIEVNPLFGEMTGLHDAKGRTAMELVPGLERKWVETYARVALDGETLRFKDNSDIMGRHFDIFAMPVEPHGRFVTVFRDVTEQTRIQNALAQSEAQFRSITEAMPQVVWAATPDGHNYFFNARWYEFTGIPEGTTDGAGWQGLFHPDDQDSINTKWQDSVATGKPFDIEYRLRHHSDGYRWVLGRAQPVRDSSGQIIRWLGTCTDIHEIKLAEGQRQLMLDEMNHRVKNTLAMVHAIVSQTLRQAENLPDANAAIQARLGMMAQAHDRLVRTKWTDTKISEVVEAALAPHSFDAGRYSLSGPNLAIGSRQALALTMALHELATNAAKYGALSVDAGRVTMDWAAEGDGSFRFVWVERDGPAVTAPQRRGFGSRMIEQALAGYFNGDAQLIFAPTGLEFCLNAPVDGLTL
jgi:PAS domain S-box-containing protein